MLRILRSIIQELNSAEDLSEALSIMVERIREVIEADSCSIFLTDLEYNTHVL